MSRDVCRLCENTFNLTNIFDPEYENTIPEKLLYLANIEISEHDDLPKYICCECDESLEFAYNFKSKCEYTDQKLRQELDGKVNIEKINVGCDDDIQSQISTDELIYDNNDIEYVLIEEDVEYDRITIPEEEYEKCYTSENIIDHENELEEYAETVDEETVDEIQEDSELESINEEDLDTKIQIEQYDTAIADESRDDEDSTNSIKKQSNPNQKKRFECETCNSVFTNFSEFNAHKKSHGDKRFQCKICSKWFSKRYRLKNHITIHSEEREFACKLCDKKYSNQGNLDRHIRHFHKKERPYACNICGMRFSRTNILKQHESIHTNERNFACELCGKTFKTLFYLKIHKKSHIPTELRKTRQYKNEKNNIKKTIVCNCCDKKSSSSVQHRNHMRIHTGERPYECSTCGKKFAYKQTLSSHILMHTGEKPFKCDVCGQAFRQRGHLKGHKLIHAGVKTHKCQYCPKTFTLRSNLTVHQRLHTGETPFHCDECNKKFYDSNSLRRHKILHLKSISGQESDNDPEVSMSIKPYLEENRVEYFQIIEMQSPTQDIENKNLDNLFQQKTDNS